MDQTIPPTVLLTRPRAASERFAAMLPAPVLISPVTQTIWVDVQPLLSAPDAVVFTSENGVAGFAKAQAWRGQAYCVGDRTAQTAGDAGFDATSAGGDVEDLKRLLIQCAQGQSLVHARGRDVAGDLGDLVAPMVVYEQVTEPLSGEARAILEGVDRVIVPLFSPRSAAFFAEQLTRSLGRQVTIVAMSDAVAQTCRDLGLVVAQIADRPDGPSMLRAIEAARK
ncbi:MAG: uroporphyrinogen-III synthase [Litoreibacter sp.]|uniref:uroporphyrinogen-III synthase n=1 Tax=Litoreibacter sp. TaxID=1969459 RepID=UPI0032977F3A